MVRRCRDWIGTVIEEKYCAGKHDPQDRVKNPVLGDRARNQMSWVIQKVSFQEYHGDLISLMQGRTQI
jgi:hypothetical protein